MALKGFKPAKVVKSPSLKHSATKRPTASASDGVERAPIQSLNVVEDKLRREYNLVGSIGAYLEKGLTPVILVGDLRDMGHAIDKGRGFAVSCVEGVGFAANGYYSFQFPSDTLIESFYFTSVSAAGSSINVYSTTPGETIPIAANTQRGAWRDRKTVSTDLPGTFVSAAAGARTGTQESNSNSLLVFRTNPNFSMIWPLQIMVPAGGAVTVRSAAAQSNAEFGFVCRVWP